MPYTLLMIQSVSSCFEAYGPSKSLCREKPNAVFTSQGSKFWQTLLKLSDSRPKVIPARPCCTNAEEYLGNCKQLEVHLPLFPLIQYQLGPYTCIGPMVSANYFDAHSYCMQSAYYKGGSRWTASPISHNCVINPYFLDKKWVSEHAYAKWLSAR